MKELASFSGYQLGMGNKSKNIYIVIKIHHQYKKKICPIEFH